MTFCFLQVKMELVYSQRTLKLHQTTEFALCSIIEEVNISKNDDLQENTLNFYVWIQDVPGENNCQCLLGHGPERR